MVRIRNINAVYGDPVEFDGETESDAAQKMSVALKSCGFPYTEPVEGVDYEVVG